MILRSMCASLVVAGWAASAGASAEVHQTLEQLQEGNSWGEARLRIGVVRPLRVLGLSADSVYVREVIGALHERPATYALSEIESIRVLGSYRIPGNPAPYQGPKSTWKAMGLELVIPGAGFLYIGQARQAWSLLAFTGAAVATGVLTGEDGAAGWVPMALWAKAAALAQVRDEVGAMNASHGSNMARRRPPTRRPALSLVSLRLPF